ncbi:MAG: hypothetical protein A2506_02515 [Elusimicrobia bacterium RIFOXYD12_FULL_66_9]|nr:MAG: hypothetical protein A2506_02515 [Elusimicrobia bacterium RIFOXYD12_FULL_66_9]
MEDEPKKQPDDIQGILSDLDDILSDLGSAAAPVPSPAQTPKLVEPAKPIEPPKPVEPPKPTPPPPVTAAAEPGLKIELAPREGMAPPKPKASDAKPPLEIPNVPPPAAAAPKPAEPPKAVEPPKPAEPPKPVEPPKAAEPPKPAEPPKAVVPPKAVEAPKTAEPPKAAEPAKPAPPPPPAEIPANTPKDQIRRVAYIHTAACVEAKDGFAAFLSTAARTISKKPIYLREVMSLEVANASDPNAILEKARQAKAVAMLAVTEGWSQAKSDELSEACARAGVLFRCVASGDVLKKATAVDVIVDMMLLPGES